MASLRDIGERSIVRNIASRLRPSSRGFIGDDAAVLTLTGDAVVSTDTVTFERHMPPGMTFREFGWAAAAVSFSDIASMGARPVGILAALSMPPETDEEHVYRIMEGIDGCAGYCGTHVIGGDTKPGSGSVCCTAVGDMDGRAPMTRSGARPGDMVAVTGSLGSPAAGFYAIENGMDETEAIGMLMAPMPRMKEGVVFSEAGVKACMDISDGLSTSVSEICVRSGVGMEIEWSSLPRGPGVRNMSAYVTEEEMMLCFGGEYELLFTAPEDIMDGLLGRAGFTVIGTVNDGAGAYLLKNDGRTEIHNGGYEHFKDRS